MKKSVNFIHSENKILTSFDNTFFKKDDNVWVEVKNKNVFKGYSNPLNNEGDDGDYYIQYESVGNYLAYSENFNSSSWVNISNTLAKDNLQKFPNDSYATKMIPTSINGEHYISSSWNNDISNPNYWCISLYVMPSELKYFQLTLSDALETYGLKGEFSITLNSNRKYIVEKKLTEFGTLPYPDALEYDDTCFDILPISNGVYQIFVSAKFNYSSGVKSRFQLLKNINGEIVSVFSNVGTEGLFINGAQLSKSKIPPYNYIPSNGEQNVFPKFVKLWKKSNDRWSALEDYNNIWYGTDNPKDIIGENGDLYFIHPIITLGKNVRFGKNTLYKCWEENDIKYYTKESVPSIGDEVYIYYDDSLNVVGSVISYTVRTDAKSYIKANINNVQKTLYRNDEYDFRLLNEEGLVFWNKDAGTYSYIDNNNEIKNLIFKTVYNPNLFIDAISFSTNLFNQTYSTRYAQNIYATKEFGFNSGGHGNFWDYNSLRRFY